MQNPLISIIVPCYNQAQYLDECLQSVLDQTYENWECIIVNDGSPDNTEEVAKKWLEKDHRFQYLQLENGGVSKARNKGIETANGIWILPLDADDKIEHNYLEFSSKEFEKNDIIYCKAQYFGKKSEEMPLHDFNPKYIFLENQIFCSAFFKKLDWEKANGYDETMLKGFEDWEFWIRLLEVKSNLKVKKLDYVGFFYRIKEVSRNVDAATAFNQELKKDIILKHQNLYFKNLDVNYELLFEKRKLTSKIQHLQKILKSKRYLLVDRVFRLLSK